MRPKAREGTDDRLGVLLRRERSHIYASPSEAALHGSTHLLIELFGNGSLGGSALLGSTLQAGTVDMKGGVWC